MAQVAKLRATVRLTHTLDTLHARLPLQVGNANFPLFARHFGTYHFSPKFSEITIFILFSERDTKKAKQATQANRENAMNTEVGKYT